ncbi:hypothetical protein K435DRAFT_858726 [Dendrothele bispora CBS 962.96]|uniref:DUF6534 domain-containing protein n=1 Tax=Dendrothele bispora (strain CBS 962.96) TaxID=1314807 RepID=A0A4V4HFU4_DENBC|nr:hypothetical protein K435DRAFT_858726 [Dendrothele bispora CBS 962.96]
MFTIETGALTTIFAIASLISIATAPKTFTYIFCIGRRMLDWASVLSRKFAVYTNSLLAVLNARTSIQNAGDDINTTRNLSFTKFFGKNHTTGSVEPRQTNISIKIDTIKEFISDGSIHDESDFASPDSSPTRIHKRDVDGGSPMMDDCSHFGEEWE